MRKSLIVLAPLLSAFALVGACSSKKPNPPITPTATTDAGLDGAAGDGGATATGDAAADAALVATGPTFFTGDSGSPSSSGGTTAPVLTEQALDSAIDLAITTASAKLAPKMDKEGPAGRATLKEGEHFSMMIQLAPNRCYTFIGFSPPGSISQLDIKLYAPPLFNVESGKSSPADKAMPVIGKDKAALCPILPIAVPYKIDVGATKGAGRMGIQIFARNK
jgi:hypothetical protein